MTANLFSSADWLNAENNKGYGILPIPSPRDNEISELIQSWIKMDEPTRRVSATAVSADKKFTLLGYSERMSSLAVRARNPELIFFGLIALGLDGWREDWRDNATVIALHYAAANQIGIEPKAVFERAAKLLSPKPASALVGFLNRTPADRSLEAMGYVTGIDSEGFRYKRTW